MGACTMMPPENERLRIARIENAVLPMANAALEAGQFETARRLYTRLLDVDSKSVDARIGLGDVALAERAPAEAATWYQGATLFAVEPEARQRALLAHGRAALAAGNLEAARSSFAKLADPEQETAESHAAWGFNGVGIVRLLSGEPHDAVVNFEKAVLRDPYEPRFRGNLARAVGIAARYRPATPEARTGAPADESMDVDGSRPPDRTVASQAIGSPIESAAADSPNDTPDQDAVEDQIVGRVKRVPPIRDLPSASDSGSTEADHNDRERNEPTELPSRGPIPDAKHNGVGNEEGGEAVETETVEDQEPPEPVLAEVGPSQPDAATQTQTVVRDGPRPAPVQPQTAPAAASPDPAPSKARPRLAGAFLVRVEEAEFLQVGAYGVPENARRLESWLRETIGLAVHIDDSGTVHRVRIGPIPARNALPDLARTLGITIPGIESSIADTGSTRKEDERDDLVTERKPTPRRKPNKPLLVVDKDSTYVQVGAYANHDAALALASNLRSRVDHPVVVSTFDRETANPIYRVRVGPVAPPPPQSLLDEISASTTGS